LTLEKALDDHHRSGQIKAPQFQGTEGCGFGGGFTGGPRDLFHADNDISMGWLEASS